MSYSQLRFRIVKPTNFMVYYGAILTILSVQFPMIKALPEIIKGPITIMGLLLIYSGLLCSRECRKQAALIIIIASIVNSLYYYKVLYNYLTYYSIMKSSLQCWSFIGLGLYYSKCGTKEEKKHLGSLFIALTVITAVTSLLVFQQIPQAVRSLGNGDTLESVGVSAQYLYLRNVASWAILYSAVFLLPTLICDFKKSKRIRYIVAVVIIEMFILRSQITFGIIISLVFLLFLLIKAPDAKKTIIFALGAIVVYFLAQNFLADIVYGIYNFVSGFSSLEILKMRTYQVYLLLKTGARTGDVWGRLNLYEMSIETFLNNIFIGHRVSPGVLYREIGMHSQIFDMLAAIGLVGFVPTALLFTYDAKTLFDAIESQIRQNYYILSFIMLAFLMVLNPIHHCPSIFCSVFLIPVLYNGQNDELSRISGTVDIRR